MKFVARANISLETPGVAKSYLAGPRPDQGCTWENIRRHHPSAGLPLLWTIGKHFTF